MGPLTASSERSILQLLMKENKQTNKKKKPISFDVPGPSTILNHTEADTEEQKKATSS